MRFVLCLHGDGAAGNLRDRGRKAQTVFRPRLRHLKQPGEINHHHSGRGLYFMDPAGHGMEIITRPYGSHE